MQSSDEQSYAFNDGIRISSIRANLHDSEDNSMIENFNTVSSYLLPNYPIREPVFHVPKAPSLIKVPEPRPPQRPPPSGYDMKTLRKQVEFLSNEIREREQTQSLLYKQNEQLWMYSQDLLEANKVNASIMRSQVLSLHKELQKALGERMDFARQIELARDSEKMIKKLEFELQEVQLSKEEVNRRKKEAEQELVRARQENSSLEENLQNEINRLQGFHHQLDELRNQRKETELLGKADDFFSSSRAILKSAYSRFKAGVKSRLKHARIHSTLSFVYHLYLKKKIWSNWMFYLEKRRFMHRSIRLRKLEQLGLVFGRWKMDSALEKAFHTIRGRFLVKRCLVGWRRHTQQALFEASANEKIDLFQKKKQKRLIFLAWKRTVTFIGWNDPNILHQAEMAGQMFLKKLFRAWLSVTKEENHRLGLICNHQVPRLRLWWKFSSWHFLCGMVWRRRGRLLRRFFRNLRVRIQIKEEEAVRRKFSYSVWSGIKKKMSLRKWMFFARKRRNLMVLSDANPEHDILKTTWESSATSRFVGRHEYDFSESPRFRLTSQEDFNEPDGQPPFNHFSSYPQQEEHFVDEQQNDYPDPEPSPFTLNSLPLLNSSAFTPSMKRNHSHSSFHLSHIGKSTHTSYLPQSARRSGLQGAYSSMQFQSLRSSLANQSFLSHKMATQAGNRRHRNSMRLFFFSQMRLAKHNWMLFVYQTAILKRQRLNNEIGMEHYLHHLVSGVICQWRENIQIDKKIRKKFNSKIRAKCFDSWKQFARFNQRERRILSVTEQKYAQATKKLQFSILQRWRRFAQRSRVVNYVALYLKVKVGRKCLSSAFSKWKTRWSSNLYWKVKELELENERNEQIKKLSETALRELEIENEGHQNQVATLEASISELQASLEDHEESLQSQLEEIQEKEEAKKELQQELEEVKRQFEEILQERERWKAFEEVLLREKEQEEQDRSLKMQETEARIARIQEESQRLKDEIQEAREQSFISEKIAESEMKAVEEELEAAGKEADETLDQLKLRQSHLQWLEEGQSSLVRDMHKVKSKLRNVSKDGSQLMDENEALLRSKTSAVRVLRSNTGLAEARVSALYETAEDYLQQLHESHLNEVEQAESMELDALLKIQREFEMAMQSNESKVEEEFIFDNFHRVNEQNEDLIASSSKDLDAIIEESPYDPKYIQQLTTSPQSPEDSGFFQNVDVVEVSDDAGHRLDEEIRNEEELSARFNLSQIHKAETESKSSQVLYDDDDFDDDGHAEEIENDSSKSNDSSGSKSVSIRMFNHSNDRDGTDQDDYEQLYPRPKFQTPFLSHLIDQSKTTY